MQVAASPLKPLIAGNWKMHGLATSLNEAMRVRDALRASNLAQAVDVMICPPATLLERMARLAAGSKLLVGGQNCHPAASGPFTGEIAAEMLRDAGAVAVIVGHSERRTDFGERSCDVKKKAEAAHRAGLTAIVCLGETAGERVAGLTLEVLSRQLAGSLPSGATGDNTIIAYEPVWAIGTGLTPTPGDVAAAHAFLRRRLLECCGAAGARMRLLYGGSVKPANARELLAAGDVNGALVGGASLRADDFLAIIAACGA
jgi:triosephosphate isomerase